MNVSPLLDNFDCGVGNVLAVVDVADVVVVAVVVAVAVAVAVVAVDAGVGSFLE